MNATLFDRYKLSKMSEPIGKLDVAQATSALKSLKNLRNNVGIVFQSLTEGIGLQFGQDSKESKFLAELQHQLVSVQTSVKEFEESLSGVEAAQGQIQLGNSGLVNQDVTPDALGLYNSMIASYRWTDNLAEYSSCSTTLLSQNSLKRSNLTPGLSTKRRRVQPSSQNVSNQTVDNVINTISRSFSDNLKIEIVRPFGSSTVLIITLGKIMKGIVVLKRLMVEWVVVKGFNEDLSTEDGKINMWGESRFKVFKKVTENANAAMLHFYSPAYPELAIRSFLTWFHSYQSLFTSPCKKCGHHLHNLLPPTWRDLRNLDPYHEDCKP